VEAAGSTDPAAIQEAIIGISVPNLSGGVATMLPNHHITKPVLIGEITGDGLFDIVYSTDLVPGDAWSDFLPDSAALISDWKHLRCGNYNTISNSCISQ
jgi:urea transport system substrate-binding protein